MHQQLENFMRDTEVTRLAVSVIDSQQPSTVYTLNKLAVEAIENDTQWPVASLTKPVFGYGVLQLVQQGRIDLDRPMRDYLPFSYTDDPLLPQMTVRHALTHTTGFPNWRDAQGLRAAFIPGTKFSYSSEGLTYLQQVVEHIIGIPLHEYLHQSVFIPLGMHQTQLNLETHNDLPPMLHFLRGSLLANSALSLRTTISDYSRFMRAMLDHAHSLLDEERLTEMLRPQIAVGDIPNLDWGLGWGLQNVSSNKSFWHWGARGTPRTMNFAMGIPHQQKAIVIFTDHATGLHLCRQIIEYWIVESDLPAFEWLLPAQNWRPDGKVNR